MSKERRVFVMWADSSRAAAHNLDDLRERWVLKAQEVGPEQKYDHAPAYLKFDVTNPRTLEQAQAWHAELLQREKDIEMSLAKVNLRLKEMETSRHSKLEIISTEQLRVALIEEKHFVLAMRRVVRDWIDEVIYKQRLQVSSDTTIARQESIPAIASLLTDEQAVAAMSSRERKRKAVEILNATVEEPYDSSNGVNNLLYYVFMVLVSLVKEERVNLRPPERMVLVMLRTYLERVGKISEDVISD